MRIVTVTEGRRRLGYWLKKALAGDDIGFAIKRKIVALRPVNVCSDDYAFQQYGLTKIEIYAIARRVGKSVAAERRRGSVKRFTGSADALRD
ncbi:MAG: hypothetical protein ABSH22_12085 [Tepidisphaeraceae bacterium]|jgi:hypothetical protein